MKFNEFLEDVFGTNPKRTKRTGARPDRGHNPVLRYTQNHNVKFPEPRKPRAGEIPSKSETLGNDGMIYHWQDPRAKQGVAEGAGDTVMFEIDSENAYNHIMKRFGSVIDWQGDTMVAPRKYWGAIQELAYSAGGEATEVGNEQGVAEGFADDFAAFAKERGGVLRHGPQPAKPAAAPAAPQPAAPVDREALSAELKQLQGEFDPQYQYSDDYSFWSKQDAIANRIAGIKKQLGEGEPGDLEHELNRQEYHHDKIGGRYDADEFDAILGRLKKLAKQGPMKTVYDPVKRVYKNVPVAQDKNKKENIDEVKNFVAPKNNIEAAKKFLQYIRRNVVDLASMMSFYENNYNKPYYEKKFDNFFKNKNGQSVKVVFDDGPKIELIQNVLHIPIGIYYQYQGFLQGPNFINDVLTALGTPVNQEQGISEGAFGRNYAEQLAQQVYNDNPKLDATGEASEVMDAGFVIARDQMGTKRAQTIFAYDKDFPSDFISAYAYLQQGLSADLAESDPSGLLHAARTMNRSFIITADLAEGGRKKFRVRAQSERTARERFARHYSMAKIVSVEEQGVDLEQHERERIKKIIHDVATNPDVAPEHKKAAIDALMQKVIGEERRRHKDTSAEKLEKRLKRTGYDIEARGRYWDEKLRELERQRQEYERSQKKEIKETQLKKELPAVNQMAAVIAGKSTNNLQVAIKLAIKLLKSAHDPKVSHEQVDRLKKILQQDHGFIIQKNPDGSYSMWNSGADQRIALPSPIALKESLATKQVNDRLFEFTPFEFNVWRSMVIKEAVSNSQINNMHYLELLRQAQRIPGQGLTADQKVQIVLANQVSQMFDKIKKIEQQAISGNVAQQTPAAPAETTQIKQAIKQSVSRAQQSATTKQEQKQIEKVGQEINKKIDQQPLTTQDIIIINQKLPRQQQEVSLKDVEELLKIIDQRAKETVEKRVGQTLDAAAAAGQLPDINTFKELMSRLKQAEKTSLESATFARALASTAIPDLTSIVAIIAQMLPNSPEKSEIANLLSGMGQSATNRIPLSTPATTQNSTEPDEEPELTGSSQRQALAAIQAARSSAAASKKVPNTTATEIPLAAIDEPELTVPTADDETLVKEQTNNASVYDWRTDLARWVGILDDLLSFNPKRQEIFLKFGIDNLKNKYDELKSNPDADPREVERDVDDIIRDSLIFAKNLYSSLVRLLLSMEKIEFFYRDRYNKRDPKLNHIFFPAYKNNIYRRVILHNDILTQDFNSDDEFLSHYIRATRDMYVDKVSPFIDFYNKYLQVLSQGTDIERWMGQHGNQLMQKFRMLTNRFNDSIRGINELIVALNALEDTNIQQNIKETKHYDKKKLQLMMNKVKMLSKNKHE